MLKVKVLLFFSARWVSRYPGIDVTVETLYTLQNRNMDLDLGISSSESTPNSLYPSNMFYTIPTLTSLADLYPLRPKRRNPKHQLPKWFPNLHLMSIDTHPPNFPKYLHQPCTFLAHFPNDTRRRKLPMAEQRREGIILPPRA